MPKLLLTNFIFFLIVCTTAWAQSPDSSTINNLDQLPTKYLNGIDKKIKQYDNRITSKTKKTLTKLSNWENKIKGLIQKVNPEAANRLFANNEMTFSGLLYKIQEGKNISGNYATQYNEYRDQLTTGLQYIQSKQADLDSKLIKPVAVIAKNMNDLEVEVANSEVVEKFIRERKKQLIEGSIKYIGKSKYLQKINKESYYYAEPLRNYKEIFSDPKKAEATLKEILNKIPAFKKFTQQNSRLASLFETPLDYGSVQSLTSLQTRVSVNTLMGNRLNVGGPNASEMFSQNMQQAKSELNALKDKVLKASGTNSDPNLPDFKPNNQRTKTFLQRLEYGSNFQFAKTNSLLPATADIGLSIGYKLNDKSVLGLGASYKMGMGSIQHISMSHQGLGLRSFIDWKLKKQFFVSGGYELNHNAAFAKIEQLKGFESWQHAGLVGITKKLVMKTKLVKNTSIQLLYDLLYKNHLPTSTPILFRIGYNF